MKTKRYYIMPLALAFTVIGCSDDINSGIPQANTGDEVQFSTALSGVNTRTVYGEETDTGFPIYWMNGDKVKVASPQCNIKQADKAFLYSTIKRQSPHETESFPTTSSPANRLRNKSLHESPQSSLQ